MSLLFPKHQSSPSQQTNATPFNAKYLLGSGQYNNDNSVTPLGKNQPLNEFQGLAQYAQLSNSGHFGLNQNLHQSQSSNSNKNTRISPLKALKDSYQQQIDKAKQQNNNINDKSDNQSGKKSQSPLRKSLKLLDPDDYEDMKNKIALVQSQLPQSIKPRSGSLRVEQAQGPNSDQNQDNQIVQIPLFQQLQQRSKKNAQSLFVPKNPEKFKRTSIQSNEIENDKQKKIQEEEQKNQILIDQNKQANLKNKLKNKRMQENETKEEEQKVSQEESKSDDVNFNDEEMDNMDEMLYDQPISQIEVSSQKSIKNISKHSSYQSQSQLNFNKQKNDQRINQLPINEQKQDIVQEQIPKIEIETMIKIDKEENQKNEIKRFKSQTLEPMSLNLKNANNYAEENKKPISEKSLNKREELIIKYRIESDNYAIDNSKSLKSARIMECVNLLYNAKGQKDKKEKDSQEQKSQEQNNYLKQIYQQQPQKQKLQPGRLKDFFQRQQNFEKKKQEEIQKMKLDDEIKKQKELIFHPNILKEQKGKVRNLEQFINDQKRFKARVENNIECLKKIQLQEEKKKMKRSVSNSSKRNNSKFQIKKKKNQSSDESSSEHSDSMDEGLQPVFQKQKKVIQSDDDDINEHVNINLKNKQIINLQSNQIGVGNIQSSPTKLLLNTRSNPYVMDKQAKINQYYSMSNKINKLTNNTSRIQQPSFNAGSSINTTNPISALPQNNPTVFSKINNQQNYSQYNQSQRIPQNNIVFQSNKFQYSQSFQQNQSSSANQIMSNLNSLSNMNPFKKQEIPSSSNFNKLWENNSIQNNSPPIIQSSQNAHIRQKIITKVEIEEPFSSSDDFSSSKSNNKSQNKNQKKSFYDRKDSQKSKKSVPRSSSIYFKKEQSNNIQKLHNFNKKKSQQQFEIGIFDMDEKKLSVSKSIKDKLKQKYIKNNNSVRIRNRNSYQLTNVVTQKKNFLNKNSNKIVYDKFEKEFYQNLQNILKEEEIPEKIDSYTFTQLMISLGCARKVDMENDRTIEFRKIEELWLCLQKVALHPLHLINIQGQHSDDEVLVQEVKTFIMAVLGIQNNSSSISRENDQDLLQLQSEMFPNYDLPYGYLVNSKNVHNSNMQKEDLRLKLTNNCSEQIRQKFTILNSNRMNWLGEILVKKKLNEQLKQKYDFKPKILASATSHRLIKNKSEKIIKKLQKSQSDKKFDIKKQQDSQNQYFQVSTYRSKIQALEQNEKKLLDQCTFKPNIKKSSKMYKSNSTYFSAYLTTNLLTSNSRAQSTSRNINDDLSSEKIKQQPPNSVFTQIDKSISSISVKQKENDKKQKVQSSTPDSSKNLRLEYFKGLDKLSRCEQLFRLGQAKHQVKKQAEQIKQQSPDRIKPEDLKECTFQPKLISKQIKNEERKISPSRKDLEKNQNDKVNNEKLKELREKSFQRAVQRAREAQKEKELIQMCLQRGQQITNLKKNQATQKKQKNENSQALQQKIEPNKDLEVVKNVDKTNERIQKLYELSERYKIRKPKSEEDQNNNEQKKEQIGDPVIDIKEQKKPLLFVDIDIGEDQRDRITVYIGDSPYQLALDFCSKHGFDEETQSILQEQLQQKIQKVSNIQQELPLEKEQSNQYQNTSEKYKLGGQLQLIPESICNEDEEEDEEDDQIFNQAQAFDEETRTNHMDETSKDKSSEISQIQEVKQDDYKDSSDQIISNKKKHNFIDRNQDVKDNLFDKQLQERSLKLRLENDS